MSTEYYDCGHLIASVPSLKPSLHLIYINKHVTSCIKAYSSQTNEPLMVSIG